MLVHVTDYTVNTAVDEKAVTELRELLKSHPYCRAITLLSLINRIITPPKVK